MITSLQRSEHYHQLNKMYLSIIACPLHLNIMHIACLFLSIFLQTENIKLYIKIKIILFYYLLITWFNINICFIKDSFSIKSILWCLYDKHNQSSQCLAELVICISPWQVFYSICFWHLLGLASFDTRSYS